MYYRRLAEVERKGVPAAVAMIVRTSGSVPRREGTKMVIYEDGTFEGTIGGGEVEHRVMTEAKQVLKELKPTTIHYRF